MDPKSLPLQLPLKASTLVTLVTSHRELFVAAIRVWFVD